jgi:hypothetical protein
MTRSQMNPGRTKSDRLGFARLLAIMAQWL